MNSQPCPMTIGPDPMRRIFLMELSLGMVRRADYAKPVPKGNEMLPAISRPLTAPGKASPKKPVGRE